MARLLSVIIPARNELFLNRTVQSVLAATRGDTEVVVVCDGAWPPEPLQDHPRLNIIHFSESVGQRAATNAGMAIARGKFVMKLDAHCAVDEGFDVKLTATCDHDWTVVPRLYNLHAFDWVCECGKRLYQCPTPTTCDCGQPRYTRDIIWKPRLNRRSDFMRFDSALHFQYWRDFERRPEARGDISDVMGNLGACWLMHRKRYRNLGGLDERHGSWGQMGTEISCKSWLSGGRQVVNKTTWYSHMFRTQGKDFGFPYPLTDREIERARERSRELWLRGTWKGVVRPLRWLVEKFAPVPGWESYQWAT